MKKNKVSTSAPAATVNPAISAESMTTIRAMHERQRQSREQLGAIDLERAKLEAQAAPIRQRLLDCITESDSMTIQAGKDAGVDLTQPGWKINLTTGELTR